MSRLFDGDVLLLLLVILFIILCLLVDGTFGAASISIHKLTPNEISGSVYITNPTRYKVVIFSQTHSGMWLKQPYPGNRKSYSWAPINKSGYWRINLIERFSQKMRFIRNYCAILVPITKPIPDRLTNMDFKSLSVLAKSCVSPRR